MLFARPHHAKQLVSRMNGQTIPRGTRLGLALDGSVDAASVNRSLLGRIARESKWAPARERRPRACPRPLTYQREGLAHGGNGGATRVVIVHLVQALVERFGADRAVVADLEQRT